MKKRALPLSRVYGLLEPGPMLLITTARKGKTNVMAQSWHCMMEFEPPLVGCLISGRNYSFDTLVSAKECVLNIPTAKLLDKVVGVGNCSGRKVDKFENFGLTPKPAAVVGAPLIDECYASLECKVVDTRLMNRYNFFVLEVVKAWGRPEAEGAAHAAPSRRRPLHGDGQDPPHRLARQVATATVSPYETAPGPLPPAPLRPTTCRAASTPPRTSDSSPPPRRVPTRLKVTSGQTRVQPLHGFRNAPLSRACPE